MLKSVEKCRKVNSLVACIQFISPCLFKFYYLFSYSTHINLAMRRNLNLLEQNGFRNRAANLIEQAEKTNVQSLCALLDILNTCIIIIRYFNNKK